MEKQVPNMLWEWRLVPVGNDLVKYYVDEDNKTLRLCKLVITALPVSAKIDLSLNQVAKLTAGDAMELHTKLSKDVVNQKGWFSRGAR